MIHSDLHIIAEGPNLVISQSNEILESMDEWNLTHHGSSGLIEEVKKSDVTEQIAEIETLEFISKYVGEKVSPMCGNTVSHDRRFLSKYMPRHITLVNLFSKNFINFTKLDENYLVNVFCFHDTYYMGSNFEN